jgi:hypothetical protein
MITDDDLVRDNVDSSDQLTQQTPINADFTCALRQHQKLHTSATQQNPRLMETSRHERTVWCLLLLRNLPAKHASNFSAPSRDNGGFKTRQQV